MAPRKYVLYICCVSALRIYIFLSNFFFSASIVRLHFYRFSVYYAFLHHSPLFYYISNSPNCSTPVYSGKHPSPFALQMQIVRCMHISFLRLQAAILSQLQPHLLRRILRLSPMYLTLSLLLVVPMPQQRVSAHRCTRLLLLHTLLKFDRHSLRHGAALHDSY